MKRQADSRTEGQELSRQILTVPSNNSLRFMMLAAHPDDEIIGASALLSRFPRSIIAYLTDGAPRDSRLWTGGPYDSREQYAKARRAEAIRALAYAEVPKESVCWLGAVDQQASFEMSFFAAVVARLLEQYRPDAILTHSYEGGHPDHDAAAVVAQLAASRGRLALPIIEMTSYHARNGRCVTGEFLPSKSRGEAAPEIVIELSESDRDRKQKMLKAHASQQCVLENLPTDRERLRLSPGYDFSQLPHPGKLWYECLGWPMTGSLWRELAATVGQQEPSCA